MTAKAICYCNTCGAGIYDTSKATVYPGDPPALVCHRCEMRRRIRDIWARHLRPVVRQPDELIHTILKICTGG